MDIHRGISKWAILLILVVAVGIYGCSSSSTATTGAQATPAVGGGHGGGEPIHHEKHAAHTEHANHATGPTSGMEKMQEGLAKLSETDRTSAEKQHVCPVSGQMLGTMGAPTKVNVHGRDVWLCCPGCEGQLRENPDQWLANLAH